jgi:hypothetical protein
LPDEQALDSAAGWDSVAEEAGGEHARVVDDDEVARPQQIGQRPDGGMQQRSVGAAETEQARRRAFGRWFLCDEISGEIEIELADVHPEFSW